MDLEEGDRWCGVPNMGSRGEEPRIISRMTENGKETGNRVDMRPGERNELQLDGKYMSRHEWGRLILPGGSRRMSKTEEGNVVQVVDEINRLSDSPRKTGGIAERGSAEENRRPIRFDRRAEFNRK